MVQCPLNLRVLLRQSFLAVEPDWPKVFHDEEKPKERRTGTAGLAGPARVRANGASALLALLQFEPGSGRPASSP
ncbi:hypothetical protein SKAU_G00207070 [Synaphobranchus kaupii]|uniref:Uncharacterized protein n=1 Tax=Synaphobranchus kaupii TaxID=118154 RepID=A0A9Q1F8A2_SYNKA|nr:hypothetical protein SKAU_G00207070 [Synaphobranchus kaupii]